MLSQKNIKVYKAFHSLNSTKRYYSIETMNSLATSLLTILLCARHCLGDTVAVCNNNVVVPAVAECEVPFLDGSTIQKIASGSSSTISNTLDYQVTPSGPFGIGEHQVTLTVSDGSSSSSSCTATFEVVDDVPLSAVDVDCGEVTSLSSCDLPQALTFDTVVRKPNGCAARVTSVQQVQCLLHNPSSAPQRQRSCEVTIRPDFSVLVDDDDVRPPYFAQIDLQVTLTDFMSSAPTVASRVCTVCVDDFGCRRRRRQERTLATGKNRCW